MTDDRDTIKAGDLVDVYVGQGKIENAFVLYAPEGPGDCWHLRTENDEIVYVQQFTTMFLRHRAI